MSFRVPDSTPPSTPDSRRSTRNPPPSTTPAGFPPSRSLIPSSTPAGPPPRSLFGASQNPGSIRRPNFNHAPGSSPPKENTFFGLGSGEFSAPIGRPASRGRYGFNRLSSSPQPPSKSNEVYVDENEQEEQDGGEDDDRDYGSGEEDEEEYEDEEMEDEEYGDDEEDRSEEDDEEDDEDRMDEDEEDEDAEGEDDTGYLFGSQRAPLRSARNRDMAIDQSSPVVLRTAAKQTQYDLLKIAKGLTPNATRTPLQEKDDVILETEKLMSKLHASMSTDTMERRTEVLSEVAEDLVKVWREAYPPPNAASNLSMGRAPANASDLVTANSLASLIIQIHHPGRRAGLARGHAFSLLSHRQDSRHRTSIPRVLLDWLNDYHTTSGEVAQVLRERDGYSASPEFWDAVNYTVLRGNFNQTLKLLKGARFENAESAAIDGLGTYGYRGVHLDNVNSAVNQAILLLQDSPAVSNDDWDIKNSDWAIFRQRVSHASAELQEIAEGDSRTRNSSYKPFQADNFGISHNPQSVRLSVASRKAESNVPWTVYQNLTRLYKLLLGGEEEIMATALDYLEATIALTVWWDGEEDEVPQGSLNASRRTFGRSRARTVDLTPVHAYTQRLSSALAAALASEENFSVNTTSKADIGLACILEDNTEGVLQILRSWSPLMASAVAEIASSGDWFRRANGIMSQFDQSDLMLLSFSPERQPGVTKDDLLSAYASLLVSRESITSFDRKTTREGWELGIQILERMDDERTANERIDQLLDDLPIESSERVDKILELCSELGLSKHASRIASKYADHLSKNTQNYGDTLMYYARAHNATRIQEVLQILVSHCLVKSMAYPPFSELDSRLKSIITSPKQTLTQLARTDSAAAELLANNLSGYATIRKFYDLRDEEIYVKAGEKPAHRPMERKRAAAAALIVIIESAASSIRGGLYDPSVETVVQVDGLLCLLGEVLVFVNQPKRTLTLQNIYKLLAAIEDLSTAPSLIRTQCEECFSAALEAAHSSSNTSPPQSRYNLAKSTSNLTTASSQFSLIGSADLGSAAGTLEGRSTESSAVLIEGGKVDDARRGWDWRKGFRKGRTGDDVIRILRLGIAHEVGRAWVEGEN